MSRKNLFLLRKNLMGRIFRSAEKYLDQIDSTGQFIEIGTNDFSVKGQILWDFIKKGWNKNMQINSELTKELFSKLIKGSHKDRKFLFNLKESYLLEVNPKSFNESYTESVTGKSQKKYIRLV